MKIKHGLELPPWVSASSSPQIQMLNTLQARNDRNAKNSRLKKIEFTQTELSLALPKDQQEFELELFQQFRFSALQEYLKKISESKTIPSELYLDEKRAQSKRKKTEMLNQYFQSVFTCPDYKADCQARHETFISSFHFPCPEVRNVLLSLDIDILTAMTIRYYAIYQSP